MESPPSKRGSSGQPDRKISGSIRQVFFERLVAGRECGECTACCESLEINAPSLRKPANVLCPHNTGSSCRIYAERPDVCQTWYCLWRRIDALPEFTRPDKIGVMFSLERQDPARTPFEQLYIMARRINDDFANPRARAAIQMFIDEGTLPVWLGLGADKLLIYPDKTLADAIMNPTSAPESLAPQVATWRRRLQLEGAGV
jgi:hypothetical protein